MGKEDNIRVFQDTERLCKENPLLREAISKSIQNQKMISEREWLPELEKKIQLDPADIMISKKRSLEAASAYPLYFCLNTKLMWKQFYASHRAMHDPVHNDDIIYTPSVAVFKSDTAEPHVLEEKDWYKVNVITCAAPNLRKNPSNAFNTGDGDYAIKLTDQELLLIHEKRLRRILDVALMKGNEVVILGAFGCGSFANKPEIVAMAAKNVIQEYRYAFVTIEFAIYCNPWDMTNYKIFNEVLQDI